MRLTVGSTAAQNVKAVQETDVSLPCSGSTSCGVLQVSAPGGAGLTVRCAVAVLTIPVLSVNWSSNAKAPAVLGLPVSVALLSFRPLGSPAALTAHTPER